MTSLYKRTAVHEARSQRVLKAAKKKQGRKRRRLQAWTFKLACQDEVGKRLRVFKTCAYTRSEARAAAKEFFGITGRLPSHCHIEKGRVAHE